MNNENFHPMQRQPAAVQALHHWDAEKQLLWYEYNGVNIFQMQFAPGEDPGFRHGSDGSMHSIPFIQQLYFEVKRCTTVQVQFRLSAESGSMRPVRAGADQAVWGRCGQDVIGGANGLYDFGWDLLLDWHGVQWRFLGSEQQGEYRLFRYEFDLTPRPAYLNIRPKYYKEHLGYRYHEPWNWRPNPKAAAGWCSWEAYRRDIDEQKIRGAAEFLARELKRYGLEYLQVDDGYQKMPLPSDASGTMADGWLTCQPDRFPQGHEGIVAAARENGLTPAIWTNANITNPEFARLHPEAVIHYQGNPLKGEWIDYLYTCTPEVLEQQAVPIFARLREKGYRYVKIDAIRHLLFDGLHECVRLGMFDDEEARRRFRAYMEATRRGLGDDVYYLASWGELTEVVGLTDACRISMDANPTWAGIHMQLFESARWFHTQRVLFTNDPDHVCVRAQKNWVQTVLSVVSLTGGLYMLSDPLEAYTPDKLELIRKTLPPLTTVTAETGPLPTEYPAYTWTKLHGFAVQSKETPVEAGAVSEQEARDMAGDYPGVDAAHPFGGLWAIHLQHAGRSWCTAIRAGVLPLPASELRVEALGLDPDADYAVFDFWAQKPGGTVRGTLPVPPVELGGCQVLALVPAGNTPCLLADDRHVSMGAVDVEEYQADRAQLRLVLAGQPGETRCCWFYLPAGLACCGWSANAAPVQSGNGWMAVQVTFAAERETVELRFEEVQEC